MSNLLDAVSLLKHNPRTVVEIAELLRINQKTVRLWFRDELHVVEVGKRRSPRGNPAVVYGLSLPANKRKALTVGH